MSNLYFTVKKLIIEPSDMLSFTCCGYTHILWQDKYIWAVNASNGQVWVTDLYLLQGPLSQQAWQY